jgi:flagellar motor switch protein FliM
MAAETANPAPDGTVAPGSDPARPAAESPRAPGPRRVERYNFRQPVFLSEAELRRLQTLHEDFIRYLSARLSLHLRMEFAVKLAGLEAVPYAQFTGALPSPAHLTLFKLEPLAGVGILGINPRLALTIADRLLGGRGGAVKAERDLTEIETALMEGVMAIVLEEWCAQWKSVQELRPLVIGQESSGRFLQTSPRDAAVIALSLEATFGDCTGTVQLGVPCSTIDPLLKKVQASRQRETGAGTVERTAAWHPAYDGIAVPVRAEWQALEFALRELASLRVGDVIELPAALFSQTRVLFNGVPKFTGTVGLDADRVAVQLTRKLSSEETAHAHSDGR